MVFNSLTFIAFFACVLALHSLPLRWTTRKINLLIASYIFYTAWNPPFVILLWISTVVDWYAAQGLVKAQRQSTRHAWLFQVRSVSARQLQHADGLARCGLSATARRHRAAGRHLVLYLRHLVLHAGRLSAP